MKIISRENAVKLLSLVRSIIEEKVDFKEIFFENTLENNIELNEIDFSGIGNGFLSEVINIVTGYKVEVIGDVESLYTCPCCSFKTLTELYDKDEGTGYDICSYCMWEDDGTKDINSYSSINKGSIADYRNKICSNPDKYYTNKWLK